MTGTYFDWYRCNCIAIWGVVLPICNEMFHEVSPNHDGKGKIFYYWYREEVSLNSHVIGLLMCPNARKCLPLAPPIKQKSGFCHACREKRVLSTLCGFCGIIIWASCIAIVQLRLSLGNLPVILRASWSIWPTLTPTSVTFYQKQFWHRPYFMGIYLYFWMSDLVIDLLNSIPYWYG